MPIKITPSSFSDPINVSLSGFDNTHWKAEYNSTMKKIDLSNLIQQTEAVGWLDDQVLAISASIESIAGNWTWTKRLKPKKRLDKVWNSIKQDAVDKINDLVSPADDVRSLIVEELRRVSAFDSEGLVHCISPSVIHSVGNMAYERLNTTWANFVRDYIWSDISISELHHQVVNESWSWNWKIGTEIQLSGVSISLDPKIKDFVQFIDSISETGFSSETFEFQWIKVKASVAADGEIANADFNSSIDVFLRYAKDKTVDADTGQTAKGYFDFGIGLSLHIVF